MEKYDAAALSVFDFFRATNHLFYKDLGQFADLATYSSSSPTTSPNAASTSTKVWLSGDMHVNNLGTFHDDQGTIAYAMNDFDESIIGDYQLDVWRMTTALYLVLRVQGFTATDQATVADTFLEAYLDEIEALKAGNAENTDTTHYQASNTGNILQSFIQYTTTDKSRAKLLSKYTTNPPTGPRYFDLFMGDLIAVSPTTYSQINIQLNGPTPSPAGGPYKATLKSASTYTSAFFKVKDIAQRINSGGGKHWREAILRVD